jgi:hypothetical protein
MLWSARTLAFVGLLPLVLRAEDAPQASFPAKVLPTFGTMNATLSATQDRTDGSFSLMLPLRSSLGDGGRFGGSLLFASPYAQWFDTEGQAAGVSLGFRHLFSNQAIHDTSHDRAGFLDEGFYLGGDVSLDMGDLTGDRRVWQMGFGAEIGTRYFELRGRYHLPIDDGRVTQSRSTQTIAIDSNQRLSNGSHLVTTATLTVRSVVTLLTESLPGWEVEASALVPGLDRWMDVNLVTGYARYHSDTFSSIDYDTWRFGVEARPVPAVVLGATYFSNEHIVGDHWLFSIGLELPFETADIGDGKGGFWGHIKDAFKPRRRHLSERLIEPVRKHSTEMQFSVVPTKVKSTVTANTKSVIFLRDGTVVQAGSDWQWSSGAVFNLFDWSALSSYSSSFAVFDTSISSVQSGLNFSSYRLTAETQATFSATDAVLTHGAIYLGSTQSSTLVTGGSLALVGPHGERIYVSDDYLGTAAWQSLLAQYTALGYTAPINP